MSEPAAAGRDEIWVEKYRPRTLDEVVGQDRITDRLESYVERNDLPHLLFAGEAGIGKCVTGETPVLTSRGVERIAHVVGEIDGFGQPDDGMEVLSFDDDGEFQYVEPSHVFSKSTDETVIVETRDGGDVTATPEHRFLVIDSGGLEWRRADELEPGARIVRPLRTPTFDTDDELTWISAMDGERTFVHVTEEFAATHGIPVEEDYVGTKKRVFRELRTGTAVDDIAAKLDVPRKTVRAYEREFAELDDEGLVTTCSLSFFRELDVTRDEVREHVETVQYVTPQNLRSRRITPPWRVTPELARFVGLAMSEARIERGRVKFYNTDERLLDQFKRSAREVFNIEVDCGEQRGVQYVEIQSRTVTHFLESCFDVFDDGAERGPVGSALVHADAESRAAFVRAVFDAEGHVTDGGIIELTQKNGDAITLLAYLLAGFGVPSRRKTDRKAASNGSGVEREYHTLYVSGADALRRFEERVGFTVDEKAERLERNAARDANPNYDTIPSQTAVETLCEELRLDTADLLSNTLNPDTPGRRNHVEEINRVLDAAADKLEAAQTVRARVKQLHAKVGEIARVPAAWVDEREELEPLEARRRLAEQTGVRSDRLLEYADGRRTPTARRTGELLRESGVLESPPDVETVQRELRTAIETLGVSYEYVANGTELYGNDINNLLTNDDHDLSTLPRFATVTERVTEVATEMLSMEVIETMSTLDLLARSDLYFDEVERVERVTEPRRVFDLTVPGTRNYVAGLVPTVMHNTTSAVAIARELYGDDWESHFMELNASDERGIDVVRDRIKNFADKDWSGSNYRIIFLDEADSLTSDAQSALRRTMEQFSHNVRFILSCNYSSRIIDPIQSRCAVFRFRPIPDEAVADYVRYIADEEGIEVTDDGVDALVYAADGDMRKAINGLQAAAVTGDTVDAEAVYTITSTARPEEVEEMVTSALDGDFTAARSILDDLVTEKGLAGGDIIDQLHRSIWEFDVDDEAAVRLLDRVGEADYRITEGANERVQLEALLASVALENS